MAAVGNGAATRTPGAAAVARMGRHGERLLVQRLVALALPLCRLTVRAICRVKKASRCAHRNNKSRKLLPPFRHSGDPSALAASLQSTNYILVHLPRTPQVRSMTSLLSSDVLLYRPVDVFVVVVARVWHRSVLRRFRIWLFLGRMGCWQARTVGIFYAKHLVGRGTRSDIEPFLLHDSSELMDCERCCERTSHAHRQPAGRKFCSPRVLEMHKEARRRRSVLQFIDS